jgi:hypothetical protein
MGQPIAAAAPATRTAHAEDAAKPHEHHLSDPRAEIWADQIRGDDD